MSGYWSVPPEWTGETCCILGGGPSLASVDFRALNRTGCRVIAINDAFRFAPWADVLYCLDVRASFTGKYLVTLENRIYGVKRIRNTGELGLETDPAGLRHGHNSGYQCINLAVHLGVSRIILFGYDMHVSGERTHAMDGVRRQDPGDFDQILRDKMLPCFPSLVEPLAAAGVEVWNATPGSRLRCWKVMSQRDAIAYANIPSVAEIDAELQRRGHHG
jgi:hypothetical protein